MKLSEAKEDQEVIVSKYVISGRNENPGWKRKLIGMGIIPGAKVKILRKDGRNTILKLQNSRISICNSLADKLEVNP